MNLASKKCDAYRKGAKNLLLKIHAFLTFLFILLSSTSPLGAVYTSHHRSDSDYQKAAVPFKGVVLIKAKDASGNNVSSGSGTLVKNPETGKVYVLTASHVLKGADQYELVFEKKAYSLGKVSHFQDFLFETFSEKTILVAKDLHEKKRLFVLRMKEEKERLKEVLMSYGLDLAIAPVKELSETSSVYDIERRNTPQDESSWVVGFGEAGSGNHLGRGLPFWVYGSGKKRAFETTLKPRYRFELLDGETMTPKGLVSAYVSVFQPGDESSLSGHVGPGDSGGPALSKATGKVIGLVSGTVSSLKKDNEKSFWEKLLRRIGNLAGSRSPLSYLLWQEANVYGSEAIYAGVTSPLIHEWIESCMAAAKQNTTQIKYS